jgi:hypothetical protein
MAALAGHFQEISQALAVAVQQARGAQVPQLLLVMAAQELHHL